MTLPVEQRALLLDLDGTLADSLSVMRSVYRRFLDGFGAVATDVEFAYLNGPPLPEVIRLLKEAHNLPATADVLVSSYDDLLDQAYLEEVEPTAGARVLLERARALGYIVAVVTSNSTRRARMWLDRVGLTCLVNVLITGEDVLRGKPDPEPYLMAAARAGCSVAASIAVEDSPQGARAATEAGIRTFVLDLEPGSATTWPEGVERITCLNHLAERLSSEAAFSGK